MSSSVTEVIHGAGSWRIDWKPDTPLRVKAQADVSRFPMSLLRISSSHVDDPSAQPGLYTGLLTSCDQEGIGGPGLPWLLGEPGNGVWAPRGEVGPADLSTVEFSDFTGSIEAWMGHFLPIAGLILGNTHGHTLIHGGQVIGRSVRTLIDSFIMPVWGVEWKVNTDLTVDFGTPAELYPEEVPLLVRDGGRAGVGSNLGIQIAQLGLSVDVTDIPTGLTVFSQSSGTYFENNPPSFRKNPLGGPLMMQMLSEASDPEAADSEATQGDSSMAKDQRTARVSTLEYSLTGRVKSGGYVNVYDAEAGFWDMSRGFAYKQEQIYPVLLRIQSVDWPVQEGVGVYLDRRHVTNDAFDIVDLTKYVEWADADADTTLSIGDLPASIGGVPSRAKPVVTVQKQTFSSVGTINLGPSAGSWSLASPIRIVGIGVSLGSGSSALGVAVYVGATAVASVSVGTSAPEFVDISHYVSPGTPVRVEVMDTGSGDGDGLVVNVNYVQA